MPVFRTRVGLFLTALAVIALELALMRALSLRFWHHLAALVISAALLGVGASGTAISLLRRRIVPHRGGWLAALAVVFAVSIPLSLWVSRQVPLDVEFLAWDLSRLGNLALLELVMFVPFFLSAAVLGVALMDRSERISGHYAANLIGSGLGAVGCVAAMHVLEDIGQLVLAVTIAALLAAAVLTPWRRVVPAAAVLIAAAAVAAMAWLAPYQPTISPYKPLPGFLNIPGTRVLHHAEGPMGQIDVVGGPAIHYAPPLSLQYFQPPPPHVLLIVDAHQTAGVYHVARRAEWVFMDYTTAAMPYHLRKRPSALILGAGGGEDIGLALFHHSRDVVAIEMNRQVIDLMTGPLAGRGGDVYRAEGVTVVHTAPRGYLAAAGRKFDVIQLSAAGGAASAARESYLCTVEAVDAMVDRLSPAGLLCLTTPTRTPPRDGLRMFNTAATALRRRGRNPAEHLAMIRGPRTVSILVSPRPLDGGDCRAVRAFCDDRSFDLCHLPGLTASEANQCNKLDEPYYHQGAAALLGDRRQAYIDNYLFDLTAPTDEKPFFFHFLKWRALASLSDQLGAQSRAYLELGYLILLAALAQAVVLAAVMILLPLVPGLRTLKAAPRRAATLGYFLCLGVGFMLLEMGFLQKLILYLAHPIYSAAVVIAGFLIFAGLGSQLSRYWRATPGRIITRSAAAIVGLAVVYMFLLDDWLALTQGRAVWVRFAVAAATIAPPAVAMGHMFPTALRRLADPAPALVPWAWAINGFASVVATVGAPLLAMSVGFSRLTLVAAACYALAGVLGRRLPSPSPPFRPR